MSYEITVLKDHIHLFATAKRSILNDPELIRVYNDFLLKGYNKEPYTMHITQWEETGVGVDMVDVITRDMLRRAKK